MCPPATHYVGADVAKDTITLCGPTVATIDNTPAALDAYLQQLPMPAHLICEATGGVITCSRPAARTRGSR